MSFANGLVPGQAVFSTWWAQPDNSIRIMVVMNIVLVNNVLMDGGLMDEGRMVRSRLNGGGKYFKRVLHHDKVIQWRRTKCDVWSARAIGRIEWKNLGGDQFRRTTVRNAKRELFVGAETPGCGDACEIVFPAEE